MLTAKFVVFLNPISLNGARRGFGDDNKYHTVYLRNEYYRINNHSMFGTRGDAMPVNRIVVFPRFIHIRLGLEDTLVPQSNVRFIYLDSEGSNYLERLTESIVSDS